MKLQSSIEKLLALISVLFFFGGTLHAEETTQTQGQQHTAGQAKDMSKECGLIDNYFCQQ